MGKKIDMTGWKMCEHGVPDSLWTVINIDTTRQASNKAYYWNCICQCGNKRSVLGKSLRNGTSISCGCKTRNKYQGRKIDMSGWKMWEHGIPNSIITVIEPTEKRSSSGNIYWLCKCRCGNIIERNGQDIRNGITKSCGCLETQRKINLNSVIVGKIYNNLKVLQDLGLEQSENYLPNMPRKGYFRHFFLCECLLCGNKIKVRSDSILNGHTSSCGCLKSRGEEKIQKILIENKIIYEHDKIFTPLLKDTGKKLRFDFIIYNKNNTINRFVEFDGEQHITGIEWGNNKTSIFERDKIKNEWCLKNNYLLIRIPYAKLNTLCLEDIMGDKFIYKGDDS